MAELRESHDALSRKMDNLAMLLMASISAGNVIRAAGNAVSSSGVTANTTTITSITAGPLAPLHSGYYNATSGEPERGVIVPSHRPVPSLRSVAIQNIHSGPDAWRKAVQQWEEPDPLTGRALKDWPAEWYTGKMKTVFTVKRWDRQVIAEEVWWSPLVGGNKEQVANVWVIERE